MQIDCSEIVDVGYFTEEECPSFIREKGKCVTVQIITQSRDFTVTLNVFLFEFLNINYFLGSMIVKISYRAPLIDTCVTIENIKK